MFVQKKELSVLTTLLAIRVWKVYMQILNKFSSQGKVSRIRPLFRSINENMKLFLFPYFRFGTVCVATRLYR